jgi:hypothetical protein
MILTNSITTRVSASSHKRSVAAYVGWKSAGIGTYDINEKSVNKTWLSETRSSISQTIGQGIGATFDLIRMHVMAGYRFLMRYYDSVSTAAALVSATLLILLKG